MQGHSRSPKPLTKLKKSKSKATKKDKRSSRIEKKEVTSINGSAGLVKDQKLEGILLSGLVPTHEATDDELFLQAKTDYAAAEKVTGTAEIFLVQKAILSLQKIKKYYPESPLQNQVDLMFYQCCLDLGKIFETIDLQSSETVYTNAIDAAGHCATAIDVSLTYLARGIVIETQASKVTGEKRAALHKKAENDFIQATLTDYNYNKVICLLALMIFYGGDVNSLDQMLDPLNKAIKTLLLPEQTPIPTTLKTGCSDVKNLEKSILEAREVLLKIIGKKMTEGKKNVNGPINYFKQAAMLCEKLIELINAPHNKNPHHDLISTYELWVIAALEADKKDLAVPRKACAAAMAIFTEFPDLIDERAQSYFTLNFHYAFILWKQGEFETSKEYCAIAQRYEEEFSPAEATILMKKIKMSEYQFDINTHFAEKDYKKALLECKNAIEFHQQEKVAPELLAPITKLQKKIQSELLKPLDMEVKAVHEGFKNILQLKSQFHTLYDAFNALKKAYKSDLMGATKILPEVITKQRELQGLFSQIQTDAAKTAEAQQSAESKYQAFGVKWQAISQVIVADQKTMTKIEGFLESSYLTDAAMFVAQVQKANEEAVADEIAKKEAAEREKTEKAAAEAEERRAAAAKAAAEKAVAEVEERRAAAAEAAAKAAAEKAAREAERAAAEATVKAAVEKAAQEAAKRAAAEAAEKAAAEKAAQEAAEKAAAEKAAQEAAERAAAEAAEKAATEKAAREAEEKAAEEKAAAEASERAAEEIPAAEIQTEEATTEEAAASSPPAEGTLEAPEPPPLLLLEKKETPDEITRPLPLILPLTKEVLDIILHVNANLAAEPQFAETPMQITVGGTAVLDYILFRDYKISINLEDYDLYILKSPTPRKVPFFNGHNAKAIGDIEHFNLHTIATQKKLLGNIISDAKFLPEKKAKNNRKRPVPFERFGHAKEKIDLTVCATDYTSFDSFHFTRAKMTVDKNGKPTIETDPVFEADLKKRQFELDRPAATDTKKNRAKNFFTRLVKYFEKLKDVPGFTFGPEFKAALTPKWQFKYFTDMLAMPFDEELGERNHPIYLEMLSIIKNGQLYDASPQPINTPPELPLGAKIIARFAAVVALRDYQLMLSETALNLLIQLLQQTYQRPTEDPENFYNDLHGLLKTFKQFGTFTRPTHDWQRPAPLQLPPRASISPPGTTRTSVETRTAVPFSASGEGVVTETPSTFFHQPSYERRKGALPRSQSSCYEEGGRERGGLHHHGHAHTPPSSVVLPSQGTPIPVRQQMVLVPAPVRLVPMGHLQPQGQSPVTLIKHIPIAPAVRPLSWMVPPSAQQGPSPYVVSFNSPLPPTHQLLPPWSSVPSSGLPQPSQPFTGYRS